MSQDAQPDLLCDGELQAALGQWWRQQGLDGVPQLRRLDRWQRTYSHLSLLELVGPAAGQRRLLVAKRVIEQASNAIYGSPAQMVCAEYAALEEAHGSFRTIRRCSVPTPRILLTGRDMLLMDFVPGQSLESSLSALRYAASGQALRQLARSFWQLGRWLRHYQSSGAVRECRRDAVQSVLAQCEHRLRMIEQTGHPWLPADLCRNVLWRLDAWLERLDDQVRVGRCHGDFGPWNVLVTEGRLTVLDFSVSRQDCLLVDPLGVLVYLESLRHAPSFSSRRVQRLQHLFLRGYACSADPPLPLVALCESLHRICRLQDCLASPAASRVDRFRRWRVYRENLRQLLSDTAPRYAQLAR